jgi:nucleoside-diphosphate-sugar epimerase
VRTVGIVGATGFIGGQLSSRYKNVRRYGRQNISDLKNDDSDLIIIAAAPAAKWLANSEPENDLENIEILINSLKVIRNKKCVLISTIDVFPSGIEFSESQLLPDSHPEAYGANRGYLEKSLARELNDLHIVRLPGMFGPGLKKNLIFDLMNAREVPEINSASTFQFYDVRSLPGHIALCIENDLKIANLATEPISVEEIYNSCFELQVPKSTVKKISYRMITNHSEELAGRKDQYLISKLEILATLKNWISATSK